MQVQPTEKPNRMGDDRRSSNWKFLMCVAIFEIIIAVIAATGMGLNVLATSNGTADIKLLNTSEIIGKYYAHVSMKTDGYQFTGHLQNSSSTDSKFYSYENAYHTNCGKKMPNSHTSRDCDLRYAIWQWTRAYTALGTIATIIVFVTGVILLFLSCCGELCTRWCCGNREDQGCCWYLCSCTTELWLWILNIIVFILFAFSWGIILGLKLNNHWKEILNTEANQALNKKSTVQTYDFHFHSVSVGKSLWPLAVASFLALMVSFYLFIMICCGCCRNCENCEDSMRCNNCSKNYNYSMQPNAKCRQKNNTIEMACEDVQV